MTSQSCSWPFDQHIRSQGVQKAHRGIFMEDDYNIYEFQ